MPANPSVFISYRIDDTLTQAGRLHQSLEAKLGKGTVFYDKTCIEAGMKWDEVLEEKVGAAQVILVLYKEGKKWLGVDDFGQRRMDNSKDWVRREVETGLFQRKVVIPVLINEAKLPPEAALPEALRPLLKCQGLPIREAFWDNDLVPLMAQIEKAIGKTPTSGLFKNEPKVKFHPEHQYACDRNEQFQPFISLLANAARPRQHFFYIFGGEAQAHRGIFRRCVNRLKGVERSTGFQVFDFSFVVPCLEDVQCLEVELPHTILSELEILDIEMEKMAEKTLAFGLAKSPSLSKLDTNGKVFFHFSITESLWNAGIVPNLTRDFIQNFCLRNLPADAPELFFFFSVEYDDDNQSLCNEIAEALEKADFVKNLGELKMVRDEHIEQWFQTHKMHWETVEERKATKARHFGEKAPEMFMDTVQTKLKKVINEINNDDINGKRN